MRFIVVFAAVAAVCALGHDLKSCDRKGKIKFDGVEIIWAGEGENENDHYSEPNLCTSWARPYCDVANKQASSYDANDRSTWRYACAECRSNCDCPIGKYCLRQNSEVKEWGTCQSYRKQLGKACDTGLSQSSDSKAAFYGDKLNCAIFTRYDKKGETNLTHRYNEWYGVCAFGKCRECNSHWTVNPTELSHKYDYCSNEDVGVGHSEYKREGRHCSGYKWHKGEDRETFDDPVAGAAHVVPAVALLAAAAALVL